MSFVEKQAFKSTWNRPVQASVPILVMTLGSGRPQRVASRRWPLQSVERKHCSLCAQLEMASRDQVRSLPVETVETRAIDGGRKEMVRWSHLVSLRSGASSARHLFLEIDGKPSEATSLCIYSGAAMLLGGKSMFQWSRASYWQHHRSTDIGRFIFPGGAAVKYPRIKPHLDYLIYVRTRAIFIYSRYL